MCTIQVNKKTNHIPRSGLYCFKKVVAVNLECIQIRIECRIGNVALNDDHAKLKLNKEHTEFYRYMKANCHEGCNIYLKK